VLSWTGIYPDSWAGSHPAGLAMVLMAFVPLMTLFLSALHELN
jgi:hypothetical protein